MGGILSMMPETRGERRERALCRGIQSLTLPAQSDDDLDDLPVLELIPNCIENQFFPAPRRAGDQELQGVRIVGQLPECGICLEACPSVVSLGCSHSFCLPCLGGQLGARWPGPRVSFRYLTCGVCCAPLAHDELDEELRPHRELQARAEKVAIHKFQEDQMDYDLSEELGRPATDGELRERAVADMAVYLCCDCNEPYCAGRVECAASLELEENGQTHVSRCSGCEWAATAGIGDFRCMVHGHQFALFKCDSCCAPATWNCHSNHYCDRCHSNADDAKHYPCPGPDKCPLGIPHPPNRTGVHGSDNCASFVFGCIACLGCPDFEGHEMEFHAKNMFGRMSRVKPGAEQKAKDLQRARLVIQRRTAYKTFASMDAEALAPPPIDRGAFKTARERDLAIGRIRAHARVARAARRTALKAQVCEAVRGAAPRRREGNQRGRHLKWQPGSRSGKRGSAHWREIQLYTSGFANMSVKDAEEFW